MNLHHSVIYLHQTRILIQNTSLNIKFLTLLPSYIFKPLQRFTTYVLTYIYAVIFALVLNYVLMSMKSQPFNHCLHHNIVYREGDNTAHPC